MIRRVVLSTIVVLVTFSAIALCADAVKCRASKAGTPKTCTAAKPATPKSCAATCDKQKAVCAKQKAACARQKATCAKQKATCAKQKATCAKRSACEKTQPKPAATARDSRSCASQKGACSVAVKCNASTKCTAAKPQAPQCRKTVCPMKKTTTARKSAPKTGYAVFGDIHKQLADQNAAKYEGVWAYNVKGKTDRTVILKSERDAKGQLKFSFLHQDLYSLPRFMKCSIDQYRANLYFMCKDNKPLMYIITKTCQGLEGTVYTSWKDQQPVVMTKLTLAQAIDAMEKDYSKLSHLQRTIVNLQAQAKNQKANAAAEVAKLKADSQAEIAELKAQAQASAKKSEAQKQQIIAECDKKVAVAEQKVERISMEMTKLKKSQSESNKELNITVGKLKTRIGDLELGLKTANEELSKSQQANKKLLQRNKSMKEQLNNTKKQNQNLKKEVENLREELVKPEVIEESRQN